MPIEMLVGLDVTDTRKYQAYRQAIAPILKAYGGDFGYDFAVSEVLKAQTEDPINRVFTLHFPDESQKDLFFADTEYAVAKATYFDAAVGATTMIASYERPEPAS